MTKPIFIVRFPHVDGRDYTQHVEYIFKQTEIPSEYHILVVRESNLERVEFEVHNVENLNMTQFNDLKERLEENLKK